MDKKAFIFDTNFIVQNTQLNEAIDKLKDDYVVYITQVSVDERINQVCRTKQKEFDDIEEKRNTWKDIATITLKMDFNTFSLNKAKRMQKHYEDYFKDNLIPYKKDAKTFETILDRAYKKIPPFKEGDSDNGFKDSLMWLSIIDFFKEKGEKEVLFLTDDKGFTKQKEVIEEEFNKYTGKTIQIENNDYYKKMGQPKKEEKVEKFYVNYKEIREKISRVVNDICVTQDFDIKWGEEYDVKTFVVRKKVDNEYIKKVFDNLKDYIEQHIFTTKVKASDFLDLDNRIEKANYSITMDHVIALEELYEEMLHGFSEYEEQFYTAVAEIINDNYEYRSGYVNEFDLPF